MKKKIITWITVLVLIATGCNKVNNSLPSSEKVSQNESNPESQVSENIDINKEFLSKRYPGKKVLTWVYGETWAYTQEEMNTYGSKSGTKYMTNDQIIRLNDNLASKGKDYVINYIRLGGGEEYINEVKKMVAEGNAPDFITAEMFYDQTAEVFSRIMEYDFIAEGLLEDLEKYLDSGLKDYKKSVSQNVLEVSKINNHFYGINGNLHDVPYQLNWYVNVDIAEKYGINLDSMDEMDLQDWEKYCDIVYEGEKKAGTRNFKILDGNKGIQTETTSTVGYIGDLGGNNYFETHVFGIGLNGNKIINYYKDPGVKQEYKTYSEYLQKGYLNYLNPSDQDEESIYTGNLFLYPHADCTVTKSSNENVLEEINIQYSQVKKIKKIKWKEDNISEWRLNYPGVSGICSASDNKERAVDALNIIYSDKEIANIISNPFYETGSGILKTTNQIKEFYDQNNGDFESSHGMLTNSFLADSIVGNDINDGNTAKELIDSVNINEKFAGKLYDYTPIKKEVRKLKKIEKKYVGLGAGGKLKEKNFEKIWKEFLSELDKAGMEKALRYLNEQ
ncbi:MAG: hypothetical protein ACLRZ9_01365 [Eubacterium sp.]